MLALAGRVLLSVAAVALQKRALSLNMGVSRLWGITYAAMAGPALVILAFGSARAAVPGFWRDAALAGAIDALGNLAFARALRTTDVSVYGPLQGVRPVLALLFGWLFLGERVTVTGGAGVAATALGAALLVVDDPRGGPGALRALAWRVLGLGLSTFAAVFLKRAATGGPLGATLAIWALAGLPIVLSSGVGAQARGPAGALLLGHAAAFFAMQALTIMVFRATPLAYAFAFFQLGMVLQVVAGRKLFGEPGFGRRLACCAVMISGAALIALGR